MQKNPQDLTHKILCSKVNMRKKLAVNMEATDMSIKNKIKGDDMLVLCSQLASAAQRRLQHHQNIRHLWFSVNIKLLITHLASVNRSQKKKKSVTG